MTSRLNAEIHLSTPAQHFLHRAQAALIKDDPRLLTLPQAIARSRGRGAQARDANPERWKISMTSWQGADPSEPTQWLQAEAAIARDRSIPIQFHTLSIDPPNERNPLVPEGKLRITVQSEALDDIQRRIASTLHSHGLDVWPPIGSSWIGHVSLVVVPVHVPMDVASRRASAALSKAGMELPVTFDAASLRVHQLSGDDEGIELMRFPTTDSRWQPASPEL